MKGMSKWVSLVVLASTLAIASPALAEDAGGEFTSEITSTQGTEEVTAELAVAGDCQSRKRTETAYAALGKVFLIWQRGYWCWRRGVVTQFSYSRDFWRNGALWNMWRWQGWQDLTKGGGVGGSHVYRRTKGYFQQCLLNLPLICQDAFPWVAQTFKGTGGYSSGSGTVR